MSTENGTTTGTAWSRVAADTRSELRVPVSSCYWAILHAPERSLRKPGLVPAGLLSDLAHELPVELEQVHAVAVPIGIDSSSTQQRILVCAVPRSMLESVESHVLILCPEKIPAELMLDHDADPSALNFLVGEFTPKSLIVAHRSRHLLWAATFLVCALLGAVGLNRRGSHLRDHAAASSARVDTLLAQSTSDRREQTLTDLLTRARETSAIIARATQPRDAANDLAAVLASWPTESKNAKPQSLAVTPEGATLAVTVDGDASQFLKAFTPPPSFTLDEPRLVSVGSVTRLNLRLRPTKEIRQAGGQP